MARSVGPNLKARPPLEREFYTLSYKSNFKRAILNISEDMGQSARVGICVSSSRVNASLAPIGLTLEETLNFAELCYDE